MARIKLTGGAYSKSPFSKSKRPQKLPSGIEFTNVGGDLSILREHAILHEKTPSGVYTGKVYEIDLDSLRCKLPRNYKNSKRLEVVCTLGIRTFGMLKNSQDSEFEPHQRELFHRVSRIHHVIEKKIRLEEDETLQTTIPQSYNSNPLSNNSNTVDKKIGEQDVYEQIIFEYIGRKEDAERKISDYLQSSIGGIREVTTPDGDRVDLLTDKLLIEVKAATDWDNSIGQILKYKVHHPNHTLVIFLFDDGANIKTAKLRLMNIIRDYIKINIYVVSSVEELKGIVRSC